MRKVYTWWRHQMETFSVLLAICAWINRWVNNREAGDLRRYRAHYDVIVMTKVHVLFTFLNTSTARNTLGQWNFHRMVEICAMHVSKKYRAEATASLNKNRFQWKVVPISTGNSASVRYLMILHKVPLVVPLQVPQVVAAKIALTTAWIIEWCLMQELGDDISAWM